jgi:hypothetical protein
VKTRLTKIAIGGAALASFWLAVGAPLGSG